MPLIGKLRCDAALYFPYAGSYSGHGPHRKYGDKVNYAASPAASLQHTPTEDGIQTDIYQATVWHKEFADRLNGVILGNCNLKTGQWAHVLLFSSDLSLTLEQLSDYYSLRFQIEFAFPDAQQFGGLADFMHVQETALTKAAHLSLFIVNVAHVLLAHFRHLYADFNGLDLKAFFRGHIFVAESLKWLPQEPEPMLMAHIFQQVSRLGSIHFNPPEPIPS